MMGLNDSSFVLEMSMRDVVAVGALVGIIAKYGFTDANQDSTLAYRYADAMLEARKQKDS